MSEPLSEEEVPLDVEVKDVTLKTLKEELTAKKLVKEKPRVSQESLKLKSDVGRKRSSHDMFSTEVEAAEIKSSTELMSMIKNDKKIVTRQQNL
jgi:hypothetical protein